MRAADLVRDGYFGMFRDARPGLLKERYPGGEAEVSKDNRPYFLVAQRLESLDRIGVQRQMADRYKAAIDLVVQGNSKPVSDPRGAVGPLTLFSELTHFKDLTRLLIADAHVKYADGLPGAGTRRLVDALTFSRNIQTGTLIQLLVGIACNAMVLAAFEERLMQLTPNDLAFVRSSTAKILSGPSPMDSVLLAEKAYQEESLRALLGPRKDEEGTAGAVDAADMYLPAAPDLSVLPKMRQDSILAGVGERIRTTFATWRVRLKGHEASWVSGLPNNTDYEEKELPADLSHVSDEDIIESLHSHIAMDAVLQQSVFALMRTRAQLRLLLLHTHVLQYRWSHSKLPTKLAEAVPAELLKDPLGNDNFQYQITGPHSYRLYSKGTKDSGELELRYRRSGERQADGAYEPPQ